MNTKNKSVASSDQKKASPPSGKRFYKTKIFSYSALILSGIIIGWIFSILFSINEVHGAKKPTNIEKITEVPYIDEETLSDYKFINPYVLTPSYEHMYHQELVNFRKKIEEYCIQEEKEPNIEKISVYFRDMTNGFWFGINEREKFVPASLSKVPMLIAVFQKAMEDPNYMQKELVYQGSFTETYLSQHPEINDIRTSMKTGQAYPVSTLVELMITKSDNESAMLLLDDLGMDRWLSLQERLGNKVPIDAPSAVNIITVKNYSSFFRILYNASLLNRYYSEKALELLSKSEYSKGIRQAIPSRIRVAHKYGERDTILGTNNLQIKQLHHAGIVYYPGKPFFICIMTKGSDKQKMEQIIYDITRLAYEEVNKQVHLLPQAPLDIDIN